MNKEAQRIAIAEACGWSYKKGEFATYWWNDQVNKTLPPNDDGFRPCPDYLNDLNAMHEAEKVIPRQLYHVDYWQKGYGRFQQILSGLTITPYSATAAQRAEAFLRTIGKWEEAK
jgi:hypothetical protein